MSNKKTDNAPVLGCLGGIAGAIVSFPCSLFTATHITLSSLECNPPGSDCNGIVAFSRAINRGFEAFFIVTILGAIIGSCIVWFLLKNATVNKK